MPLLHTIFICASLATAFSVFPLFVHAASFNADQQDYPTLLLANYTKNPGCTTCWSPYVKADPGDTISVLVYYHNTSLETAPSTRIRVMLPTAGFTSATVTGQIIAQDGTGASGNGTLIVSSRQTLAFIPGSLRWYPDQTVSPAPPQKLPMDQDGHEILTPSGVAIGDIAPGWSSQGHMIFRAQLVNDAHESAPTAVTKLVNASGQFAAVISGTVNPNNAETRSWFEWGTGTLNTTTDEQTIGTGSHSASVFGTVAGIRPNTTYFYRVVATNTYGTTYGGTLSFSVDGNGNAIVSYQPPTAVTQPVRIESYSAVVLSGAANPNGNPTETWFEWGTTPALGIQTPSSYIPGDHTAHAVSATIDELSADTTYYYRIVSENARGKTFGAVVSFKTPAVAASKQSSSSSVTGGSGSSAGSTPSSVGAPPPGKKPPLSFATLLFGVQWPGYPFLFGIALLCIAFFFSIRRRLKILTLSE